MWMLRSVFVLGCNGALAFPLGLATANAQTPVTIGKTIGGSGFHIPSYVAMDRGYFKAEGLDARFVSLTGKALVTAGLSGNVDFVPIPSGGAQAALSGAEIRYVVGESLKSQWVDHRAQGDQQAGGPQRQDRRLRPRRCRPTTTKARPCSIASSR